jgi:hypothetical protein
MHSPSRATLDSTQLSNYTITWTAAHGMAAAAVDRERGTFAALAGMQPSPCAAAAPLEHGRLSSWSDASTSACGASKVHAMLSPVVRLWRLNTAGSTPRPLECPALL